jgi:hypothetical protein
VVAVLVVACVAGVVEPVASSCRRSDSLVAAALARIAASYMSHVTECMSQTSNQSFVLVASRLHCSLFTSGTSAIEYSCRAQPIHTAEFPGREIGLVEAGAAVSEPPALVVGVIDVVNGDGDGGVGAVAVAAVAAVAVAVVAVAVAGCT